VAREGRQGKGGKTTVGRQGEGRAARQGKGDRAREMRQDKGFATSEGNIKARQGWQAKGRATM
jgi:hypothetical protein